VTQSIFLHYLKGVVLPHLKWMRNKHPEINPNGLILFEGHKADLSEVLYSCSADIGIGLYLLPSHSSHLTRPLDSGYFRMLKAYFHRMDCRSGLSRLTDVQERIFNAFQASDVTHKIWTCERLLELFQ
jgi:hypothetical protein